MIERKIPKKCPKCGGKDFLVETGLETCRYFSNGNKIKETRRAIPRKVFCVNMKCWYLISDDFGKPDCKEK